MEQGEHARQWRGGGPPAMSPPPTDGSEWKALTPTQLTNQPVKPTDGGGRGTEIVLEDTAMGTTDNEPVLENKRGVPDLVTDYEEGLQGDQNDVPDCSEAPDYHSEAPYRPTRDQNQMFTTPSVSQSTRESQMSEPTPEIKCSYNKKGKCGLHNQIGKKTVTKRRVWVKKKFGFGWVTKQVVEYSCNQGTISTVPKIPNP